MGQTLQPRPYYYMAIQPYRIVGYCLFLLCLQAAYHSIGEPIGWKEESPKLQG
jgi:hypothetical protein